MALFEKKHTNKVLLDDTEALTCLIENAQKIDNHTEYVIRVQRGPLPEKSWRINRRYNDFVQLNGALAASGLQLPFPPKKIIGNMAAEFIAQRQVGLQDYLNTALMNPILASSLSMKRFLDPNNYATPSHELALQQVSLAVIKDANIEIGRPSVDMGWRLRKHYYLVKNRQNPEKELLSAWVEFGPDKHLPDKDMQGVFKSLETLKHPHIESIIYQHVTEYGALTIRNFNQNGSLRDVLCNTHPRHAFIKKYGNPKHIKALTTPEIAIYAYQILDALSYLAEKGLPYGHLHTGNVLLSPTGAKLLDIENGLLGLPTFYRPYVVQRRKLHATTQVDVYAFGHVLYEMTFGRPLLEATCTDLPHCDPQLKNLLEVILSPEALKQDLPSFAQLSKHPFFDGARKDAALNAGALEKPYFKLNSHLKDALIEASNKAELRLRNEQKNVRHQKRLVKVQEMMSSEEEMKKRKQILKKESRLAQEQRTLSQLGANGGKQINGKSPERSGSPTSTSTATSAGTLTPPSHSSMDTPSTANPSKHEYTTERRPSSMTPVSLPLPSSSASTIAPQNHDDANDRSALLGSICNFNKSRLRKVPDANH